MLKLIIFALLIHTGSKTLAQVNSNDTIHISHVNDFQIRGDGSHSNWKNCEWIAIQKRDGSSSYSTRVKMLYSEKGIYTLFECEDNKITATITEDFADLWNEDVFELFLKTDESAPLYFEYELSPLNKELPILVPNFHGNFLGWRPWHYEGERKIQHAVKITKNASGKINGWTGEFLIPFALLKPLQNVPPKKGMQWRINIYRIDYDEVSPSEWAWKPVQTNFHDYERFGVVVFQ